MKICELATVFFGFFGLLSLSGLLRLRQKLAHCRQYSQLLAAELTKAAIFLCAANPDLTEVSDLVTRARNLAAPFAESNKEGGQ